MFFQIIINLRMRIDDTEHIQSENTILHIINYLLEKGKKFLMPAHKHNHASFSRDTAFIGAN